MAVAYPMSSRSNSQSSTTSTTSIGSARSHVLPFDLEHRATSILTSLGQNNLPKAAKHINPFIVAQHEDDLPTKSREAFLTQWAQSLAKWPGFQLEVKEALVDEIQRKVYVRSEISGLPGGIIKESVDMMTFDVEGLLVRNIDSRRVKRRA